MIWFVMYLVGVFITWVPATLLVHKEITLGEHFVDGDLSSRAPSVYLGFLFASMWPLLIPGSLVYWAAMMFGGRK